jgi:hypothetical protein
MKWDRKRKLATTLSEQGRKYAWFKKPSDIYTQNDKVKVFIFEDVVIDSQTVLI